MPKVLVIHGPEGSGKSTAAVQVAALCGHMGHYEIVSQDDFEDNGFALAEILKEQPDVIVIDEFRATDSTLRLVADFVKAQYTGVERKGLPRQVILTPNVILCTTESDKVLALLPSIDVGQFNVLELHRL